LANIFFNEISAGFDDLFLTRRQSGFGRRFPSDRKHTRQQLAAIRDRKDRMAAAPAQGNCPMR
jgi:hypothetical protein